MQETELKKKEKREISIEKEKREQKEKKLEEEGGDAELVVYKKQEVGKAIEEGIALKTLKIPVLQTKPFKEIKAKIKAFFTEIPEIKPIKREISKIRIKTKPFMGVSRKILAFNTVIINFPSTEKIIVVPNLATKHFRGLKARKMSFDLELREISVPKRQVFVPRIQVKMFSGVKAKHLNDAITKTFAIEGVRTIEARKIKDEETQTTAERVSETPMKHSFEDFNDVQKEKWITSSSTALPSNAQLFYIHGKKESGFDVFKGLLALELSDRGRKPNLQLILSPKEEEKFVDISDDKCDYYKMVWIENCPSELLGKKPKIVEEVTKALKKETLKYIVFAKSEDNLPNFDELKKAFTKYGDFSVIILTQDTVSDKELIEIGKTFAKILQINREEVRVEEIINSDLFDILPEEAIDPLWNKLERKRNSALETLRDKYENDPKIRQFLLPTSKLKNESDEHFVMKQLAVKEILNRGKGKWKIEELDGRDYQTEWREEEARYEDFPEKIEIEKLKYRIDKDGNRIPVKRPDVTVRTEKGASIWIEVETCKNLDDPLKAVKDKLRVLTEVDESERPDEIWIVFPYRKYFLYGAKQFERRIRSYFNQFRKNNILKEFKPRIFFADFYDEKLVELKKEG